MYDVNTNIYIFFHVSMNPILVHHNYNIYLNYFIAQSQRYIFIYSKSFLHITPSVILSLP